MPILSIAEPGSLVVGDLGADSDLFDGVGLLLQSVPNPVTELFDVIIGVDGDGQVLGDGGHRRHRPVDGEVEHLSGDARIG